MLTLYGVMLALLKLVIGHLFVSLYRPPAEPRVPYHYTEEVKDVVRTWTWSRSLVSRSEKPTLHWMDCKVVKSMAVDDKRSKSGTFSDIAPDLGKYTRCCGHCYALEEMERFYSEDPARGEPFPQPDEIAKNGTSWRVPLQPPPEVEHANLLLLTEPDNSTSQAGPRGKK